MVALLVVRAVLHLAQDGADRAGHQRGHGGGRGGGEPPRQPPWRAVQVEGIRGPGMGVKLSGAGDGREGRLADGEG